MRKAATVRDMAEETHGQPAAARSSRRRSGPSPRTSIAAGTPRVRSTRNAASASAVLAVPDQIERPRAAAAITGIPEASASWTLWQNVSTAPGWTKTSGEAWTSDSSRPGRTPRKVASGSRRCSDARDGPSPTMTTRTPGRRVSGASRCSRFSEASLPTYPTSSVPSAPASAAAGRRGAGGRCPASDR